MTNVASYKAASKHTLKLTSQYVPSNYRSPYLSTQLAVIAATTERCVLEAVDKDRKAETQKCMLLIPDTSLYSSLHSEKWNYYFLSFV